MSIFKHARHSKLAFSVSYEYSVRIQPHTACRLKGSPHKEDSAEYMWEPFGSNRKKEMSINQCSDFAAQLFSVFRKKYSTRRAPKALLCGSKIVTSSG